MPERATLGPRELQHPHANGSWRTRNAQTAYPTFALARRKAKAGREGYVPGYLPACLSSKTRTEGPQVL